MKSIVSWIDEGSNHDEAGRANNFIVAEGLLCNWVVTGDSVSEVVGS